MTIATVRRLAADIMNVGQNKVRISPDGLKDAEGALTRADVKTLIEKGIVTKLKPQGRASSPRIGRRGHGRRRGTPVPGKEVWMMKIRAQRRFLDMIIMDGALKKESKRAVYKKMKSGIFRNKKAMLIYCKENALVPADYEPKKAEYKKAEPKPRKTKKTEKGVVMAKTELKPIEGPAKEEHKRKEEKSHTKKGEQR